MSQKKKIKNTISEDELKHLFLIDTSKEPIFYQNATIYLFLRNQTNETSFSINSL